MLVLRLSALLLFVCASGAPIVGLNAGAQSDSSAVGLVTESGAKWVRLNFIVWPNQAGPWDPAFFSMYDGIVDSYVAKGITPYGLIGAQSVKEGYDRNNPSAFVSPWVNASVEIIQRYMSKVPVFELFNEPNDWAGGTTAQVTPFWFATFLEKVYEQKYYGKWDVTLVSGPLFSFDQQTAADYLYQTYVAGMTQLAWDWFHQNAGTYPLDAIGYHIYVRQGTTNATSINQGISYNLEDLWNSGVVAGENYRGLNPDPKKKIWISEIGWGSDNVGLNGQAEDVAACYDTLAGSAGHRVAMTMWFTLQDFGDQGWGLVTSGGSKKPSWYAFQKAAKDGL